jgi:hypothetical protein
VTRTHNRKSKTSGYANTQQKIKNLNQPLQNRTLETSHNNNNNTNNNKEKKKGIFLTEIFFFKSHIVKEKGFADLLDHSDQWDPFPQTGNRYGHSKHTFCIPACL